MSIKKKSLAVNSIYSVIYKLLNVLFPLITATYAARTLMAAGVGKVSYAQNIVQYFVIISALGIPNYGIREIGKHRDSEKQINKTFMELFTINACSTALCVIVYYGMIVNLDYFADNRLLFATVGISLIMNFFNVDWFYQGREEYGYIAARSFVVKIISLVALFLFVKDTDDYVIYALIHSVAVAGNYLFNIINLRGKIKLSFKEMNVMPHLKPIMILLAASISIELYTLVDTTMLGTWCEDSVVGYYNNATKLARIINSLISSIALVLLPRLSYYHSNGMKEEFKEIANKVLKILIALAVPAVVGVFIFADSIIPVLFGESFYPAIITLRILSVLVMAVSLNNFFGTQILITVGEEKKLLISVVIGAVVNICLNLLLIKPYLQNGAAVASAVSEIYVLIATIVFAKKYIEFDFKINYFLSMACSIAIMVGMAFLVKFSINSLVLEMLTGVILCSATYFVAGYLLKNEGVRSIIKVGLKLMAKFRNKLKRS